MSFGAVEDVVQGVLRVVRDDDVYGECDDQPHQRFP